MRLKAPANPHHRTKEVMAFKRAAEAYLRKALASPEAAHKTLMRIGILDEKGNLTKHYR